jgi:ATP-dependent RNA helicase RhlE
MTTATTTNTTELTDLPTDAPTEAYDDAPPAHAPPITFASMNLAPAIVTALGDVGYTSPTPIQAQAIPIGMTGRDMVGAASTGTGKTAAFLIPILHQLHGTEPGTLRVLVLSPTRELAMQIDEQALALGYHLGFSSVAVVGGVDINPQEYAIRAGAEIIVATPGRLMDHMRYPYLDLTKVGFLVLDEADRMFDMGFLPDVKRIVARLPTDRQTMLFSATMPPEVRRLADEILRDPATITVDARKPAKDLKQRAFSVAHHRKAALLTALLKHPAMKSVIIFVKRKKDADVLANQIVRSGRSCGSLHSDRTQADRSAALDAFRRGACEVLVATDVAARGIDVDGVTHVVHLDVPRSSDDYIHRSGRTARAGAAGEVLTFCAPDEEGDLAQIEKAIGMTIPRFNMKGFDAGLDEARAKPRTESRSGGRGGSGGRSGSGGRTRRS